MQGVHYSIRVVRELTLVQTERLPIMNKNTFNLKRNGFGIDCFVLGMLGICMYFGFFSACLVSISG